MTAFYNADISNNIKICQHIQSENLLPAYMFIYLRSLTD